MSTPSTSAPSLAAGKAVVPSPQPRSKTRSPFVIPSVATSASPLSRMLSAMRVKSPFSQRALFGFIGALLVRWFVGAQISLPNAIAQWAIRVGMPRKWFLWCQVRSPVHMRKVIPMKSKAYRAVAVNHLQLDPLLQRPEPLVHAGLDVGKDHILCVLRWAADDFERPWRCRNPADLVALAQVLRRLGQGRRLLVALEPTGTYGDALRQALQQAGLIAHRVSPKAAADYAEIFDGVPSQHDGKDAAVVAELAAQGRSWPWPLALPSEAEQELAFQVDWLDGQRRQTQLWYGRLEALLSRHWPEATALLPLTSGVLRRCLARYGGPRGLAEDPRAADRLYRWGKGLLSRDKAEALVAGAQQTAGVPLGRWDEERLRRYAQQVQSGLEQQRQARRRLRQLAPAQPIIQAMGEVVGPVTACVLWVELGNPRDYHCGPAYRKAMGLNLKERSSGRWQG